MIEYKELKLREVRRRKVTIISVLVATSFHILLFFAFRIQFVPYEKVTVPKIMKVKRVRIPPGNRPGPLSASAAQKRAKPQPIKKKATEQKKKVVRKKTPKSTLKVASKKQPPKVNEVVEQEMTLDQKESELDVLSMIEGGEIVAGGGNMGDEENAYGVNYDGDMVYDPDYEGEPEEETVVASSKPNEYLSTHANPIVKSKPYTTIEKSFTSIPYPDTVLIKKENIRSGVCRVYLRLSINSNGEIDEIFIRSPKSDEDKEKYKIFLDTVINTVQGWDFAQEKAFVFVDVRFTIE